MTLFDNSWTRDSAIEYMLNYTSFTPESIQIEIDRYITWPGQATAYKIGEIKIKELRALAELELGNCVFYLGFIATVHTQDDFVCV